MRLGLWLGCESTSIPFLCAFLTERETGRHFRSHKPCWKEVRMGSTIFLLTYLQMSQVRSLKEDVTAVSAFLSDTLWAKREALIGGRDATRRFILYLW